MPKKRERETETGIRMTTPKHTYTHKRHTDKQHGEEEQQKNNNQTKM